MCNVRTLGDCDGLRLISNAIIMSGTAKKICFTTVEYDISRVLDLEGHATRISTGRGAVKTELVRKIKIELPLTAEEPEGKFLASVLEVHRTVRWVVINVGSQQEVWENRYHHADQDQSSFRAHSDDFVNISHSVAEGTRSSSLSIDRADAQPSFPVAVAHLVLAFVFHPTWINLELYIPSGSARAFILQSNKLLQRTKQLGPDHALFRALQLHRGDVKAGSRPSRISFAVPGSLTGIAAVTAGPVMSYSSRRRKRLYLRGGADVGDLFAELDLLHFCDLVESDDLNIDKSVPKLIVFKIEGEDGFEMEMVPDRDGLRVRSAKSLLELSRPHSTKQQTSDKKKKKGKAGALTEKTKKNDQARPAKAAKAAEVDPMCTQASSLGFARSFMQGNMQRDVSAEHQLRIASLPADSAALRKLAPSSVARMRMQPHTSKKNGINLASASVAPMQLMMHPHYASLETAFPREQNLQAMMHMRNDGFMQAKKGARIAPRGAPTNLVGAPMSFSHGDRQRQGQRLVSAQHEMRILSSPPVGNSQDPKNMASAFSMQPKPQDCSIESAIAQEQARLATKMKNGKEFYLSSRAKVIQEGGDIPTLERLYVL